MKRDKIKRVNLTIQTQETVKNADSCVALFSGVMMEAKEEFLLLVGNVEQRTRLLMDKTVLMELSADRLSTDDQKLCHLRLGKQAELLDYNFFKSRYQETVATDIRVEIFNFKENRIIPFEVKKLELIFNNGKKLDYTNKISVLSLDRLAS